MRILILGAGFGGLELAATLATEAGDAVEVTLIDRSEGFVFGFSKLDVMFGRSSADHVLHRYADLAPAGVRFVATTVRAIDPGPSGSRLTPVLWTATSSWSPSAPTCTPTPPRVWSRTVTSSTPSPAPSVSARSSTASPAATSWSP